MNGTLAGNLLATAYYLSFQLTGLGLVFFLFPREKIFSRFLMGSVTGSLLMNWLPILLSFPFDFTRLSHILALAAALTLLLLSLFGMYRQGRLRPHVLQVAEGLKTRGIFLAALVFLLAFWGFLLCTHTLLPMEDGSLATGQCTYGDMNMHLGFITSIARQETFPPDYSIMPGVRLSYPFLSDSISSSLLLLGASLRYAYILPMFFAMGQIFTAVYLFAGTVLSSRYHSARAGALLTLVLFFLNGGLGFSYFMDWYREPVYRFSDIFTGFYTTPTNLVDRNIRWVNLIADMLLPQRATLFGYAVLFPALWLLYRAVFQNRRELFPLAGLFAAALPMIHTHSFFSVCVISACWMLLWLYRRLFPAPSQPTIGLKRILRSPGPWILLGFTVIMCLIQWLQNRGKINSGGLMAVALSLPVAAFLLGICLLVLYLRKWGWRNLLSGWGIYLAALLLLALPQLLFWTFGQVAEGGFVRGYFNWGNQGDLYPWFYVKNIGVPLLPILGGICACGRKRAPLFLPVLLLWWVGELMVFTPNPYDNNKILYVAYLLLCIGAAEYSLSLYQRLRSRENAQETWCHPGIFAGLFLFFAVLSGVLTLGREAVSQYRLYSPAQTALAAYAEENTAPESVYLTGTRHNNEIASLSGRNIVCGSDAFLFYHGLDTSRRQADLRLMYEAPLEHLDLYRQYEVSYVVVSAFERNDYGVDEETLRNSFETVFTQDDIVLYRVPDMP